MSTKNLARTVIEGGRARYNRFERRHSNAVERTHVHEMERALCRATEPECAVFEPRKVVYRGFDDKLGPAMRWLRSQVGRPWDKVRGELFARFDTRTTAGRHILFDHLLAEVGPEPVARFSHRPRFGVSKHGLLQYRERSRYRSRYRLPRLPEPHGSRLYWLVPTEHGAFRQQHELTPDEAARFHALPEWFSEPFLGPARQTGDVR
jgi:hypothetical protein